MKLCEKGQQTFRHLGSSYFGRERSLSSQQIFELLSMDDDALIKRIAKAGEKIGPAAYIGRCLLPVFKKEGWLLYKGEVWVVNIVPERCAQWRL